MEPSIKYLRNKDLSNQDAVCFPSYIYREVYKTPSAIRTPCVVPVVSVIESFHCTCMYFVVISLAMQYYILYLFIIIEVQISS